MALRWLVQYYASGEAAWRIGCDASREQRRLERAVAIGKEIERAHFEWFAEPAVRFPLAAAYRTLGDPRQADRLYQAQNRGGCDGWWTCAQSELRLADGKGRPQKPLLKCTRAAAKPRLDGRLDKPLWKQARLAELRSAQHDDANWPATVMLAYDSEFLYLAVRCQQPPGKAHSPAADRSLPRRRDADLSAHDRVEVFLDIDRDFATYYRLAIDDCGWTNDSCWDDTTWDPEWFVAAGRDGGEWTAEAAIPWKELTGRPPQPRDTWAIGVQRVVPGVGFQSWSTPAAISVLPDGFGYLVFE